MPNETPETKNSGLEAAIQQHSKDGYKHVGGIADYGHFLQVTNDLTRRGTEWSTWTELDGDSKIHHVFVKQKPSQTFDAALAGIRQKVRGNSLPL